MRYLSTRAGLRTRILGMLGAACLLLLLGGGPSVAKNGPDRHSRPALSSATRGVSQASFATELPRPSAGITVGTATIAAVGSLGALLVLRRRWVVGKPLRR